MQIIFLQIESNADVDLDSFNVTWHSDETSIWRLAEHNKLMPKNSYPLDLFGFEEIEIIGKLSQEWEVIDIYFLNDCAEWIENSFEKN